MHMLQGGVLVRWWTHISARVIPTTLHRIVIGEKEDRKQACDRSRFSFNQVAHPSAGFVKFSNQEGTSEKQQMLQLHRRKC